MFIYNRRRKVEVEQSVLTFLLPAMLIGPSIHRRTERDVRDIGGYPYLLDLHPCRTQTQADKQDKDEKKQGRYTASLVAGGWAGAVLEKVTRASGQEQYAQQVIQGSHMVCGTQCPAWSDS